MEAEVANGQSGFTSVGRPKKRSSVLQKLLVKYIREIFETIDPYSAIGTDLSKRGVHPLQAGSVRPALVDRTGGRVGLSAENPFKDFALLFSANDIRLLG